MSASAEDVIELSAQPVPPAGAERLRMMRIERFMPSISLAASEAEPYSRRFTTLFIDDDRTRTGGNGCIFHAVNAWGDEFACKVVRAPEGDGEMRGSAPSLAQEYNSMRLLSGDKGFPRLYGSGWVDAQECIVMDWVEGVTLEKLMLDLAIDDDGRLSPLTAARLGRDIFDLLARMDTKDGCVVHGDISTSNLMVTTSPRTIADQVDDGAFDVRLVDFGSAQVIGGQGEAAVSGAAPAAQRDADRCAATPSFAAPELLSGGMGRASAASDVHAAASVLFLLLTGALPFGGASAEGSTGAAGAGRTMTPLVCAHGSSDDLVTLLAKEPEIAVALGHALSEAGAEPDPQRIRTALVMVDEQLDDLVAACLQANPQKRPSAADMRDALDAFCKNYAVNLSHAIRGEELEPCATGMVRHGVAGWTPKARTLVRSIGTLASAAVWLATLVSVGILTDRVFATVTMGGWSFAGFLNGWLISSLLAMPTLIGYAVRFTGGHTVAGLVRGSVGLVASAIVLAVCICLWDIVEQVRLFLLAAVLVMTAAAWCPMVLGYALPTARARRRLGLIPGDEPDTSEHRLPDSADGSAPELVGAAPEALPEAAPALTDEGSSR